MKSPIRKEVVLLGVAALLNDAASEMIFPLLPVFLTATIGATPMVVGMIEASADALSSFLKLFAGAWSDKLPRRKPFIVTGYLMAALSRAYIASASRWPSVLAARLFDRTGKGLRSAPRDALIAEITPPEHRGRAFGLHRAMDHTGALIGPLFAALLAGVFLLPLRTIFLIAVIPGALAFLLLLIGLREEPRHHDEASKIAASAPLPSTIWPPLAAIALFYLANASDVFLILQAHSAGVPIQWLPILWAAHHAIKSLFSTAAGALSDRKDRASMLALGWAIYGVIYLAFPFAQSLTFFVILFVAYAIPFTLTEGAERAWIAQFVDQPLRGKAFGAYYLTVGLFTLGGTALFGALYQNVSRMLAFHLAAGIAWTAAVAALAQKKKARESATGHAG